MFDLLDYRRRVFALYRQIRQQGTDAPESFALFRQVRDDLFANHSQTPLASQQRASFDGLRYFHYDPAYRVQAALIPADDPAEYEIDAGDDGTVTIRQIGHVQVSLPGGDGSLGVFWITGYGGGVFLPFRDATNQQDSYGGGRYLYDTIKGADLGTEGPTMLLDFNYAYHPSCYYNPRWTCPLAPPQNRLAFPVRAGERLMTAPGE